MKYRLFTILTVLLFLCASCIRPEDPAKQRAEQAEQAQGDILVGAVAPWSAIDVMLWEGMAMALDEINDAGGVLGRKIKMIKRDDEVSVEKGVLIAQEFGENPDLVAVVGHYQSFATVAHREGFQILDGESYDDLSSVGEFRRVLRRWKKRYSFDAIVLSGKLPQAGIIIREARRLGLEKPIIGGIAQDRIELLTMLGKEVKDVFLPTIFNPYSKKPEVRNFVKAFQKRHGKTPDVLAVQGYDTLYTLAHAIRHAKTT